MILLLRKLLKPDFELSDFQAIWVRTKNFLAAEAEKNVDVL